MLAWQRTVGPARDASLQVAWSVEGTAAWQLKAAGRHERRTAEGTLTVVIGRAVRSFC